LRRLEQADDVVQRICDVQVARAIEGEAPTREFGGCGCAAIAGKSGHAGSSDRMDDAGGRDHADGGSIGDVKIAARVELDAERPIELRFFR
jgi:hypothetical protein